MNGKNKKDEREGEGARGTYRREVGPFSFVFERDGASLDDEAEELAVRGVIRNIVAGKTDVYDRAADRVFQRLLGSSRNVDVDLSTDIDGTMERMVLRIMRAPSFWDRTRIRIRLLRARTEEP